MYICIHVMQCIWVDCVNIDILEPHIESTLK